MARNKKDNNQSSKEEKTSAIPSRKEVGNGVNSSSEEIKSLGGIHRLQAKIKARKEAAKSAQQPRV